MCGFRQHGILILGFHLTYHPLSTMLTHVYQEVSWVEAMTGHSAWIKFNNVPEYSS